ncbi:hypothetical protein ABIE61_000346 [Marinobacterium sp. MBR-111]|jgi:hypothetical protein|uniref:hypothetical protein n=1 Tax=Marinobacterium sp. MBR-111 TaxID=3156463 RepID=UPI003393516D
MSDLIAELHALAQRMAAAGETDEPTTVALAAEEIERLQADVEKLTRRNGLIIEEAEREDQHNRQLRIERFRQFGNEDCWIYGGDDHDNLETLVCPVVMQPQQLIEILQERDQLKAILQDVNTSDYRFSVEQLSVHDAEVIQRFKKSALETAGLSAGCVQLAAPEEVHRTWVQFADHYIDQLHQQAKEVKS